jgi:hypothetical protein
MLFHPLIQISIVWNKFCYPFAGACDYGAVRAKFHTHIHTSIRRRLKRRSASDCVNFASPLDIVVRHDFFRGRQTCRLGLVAAPSACAQRRRIASGRLGISAWHQRHESIASSSEAPLLSIRVRTNEQQTMLTPIGEPASSAASVSESALTPNLATLWGPAPGTHRTKRATPRRQTSRSSGCGRRLHRGRSGRRSGW